jgi:hypothetical protein
MCKHNIDDVDIDDNDCDVVVVSGGGDDDVVDDVNDYDKDTDFYYNCIGEDGVCEINIKQK